MKLPNFFALPTQMSVCMCVRKGEFPMALPTAVAALIQINNNYLLVIYAMEVTHEAANGQTNIHTYTSMQIFNHVYKYIYIYKYIHMFAWRISENAADS